VTLTPGGTHIRTKQPRRPGSTAQQHKRNNTPAGRRAEQSPALRGQGDHKNGVPGGTQEQLYSAPGTKQQAHVAAAMKRAELGGGGALLRFP
jgi:hypothetical protein